MLSNKCFSFIRNDLIAANNYSKDGPLTYKIRKLTCFISLLIKTIQAGINNKHEAISFLERILKEQVSISNIQHLDAGEKHYDIIPVVAKKVKNLGNNFKIDYISTRNINLEKVSDENLLIQLDSFINDLKKEADCYSLSEIVNFALWHIIYWCIALNRILRLAQITEKKEAEDPIYEDVHHLLADELGIVGHTRNRWDKCSSLSIMDIDKILEKINGVDTLKNTVDYLLQETTFFNFRSNNFNKSLSAYMKHNEPNLLLDFESYFYILSISIGLKNSYLIEEKHYSDNKEFMELKRVQLEICK